MLTRRHFTKISAAPLIGGVLVHWANFAAANDRSLKSLDAVWPKLEAESGGRLGVAVLDTESRTASLYRGDERFPMCSTFKLLAVAATLRKVEQGKEQLVRRVSIEAADILSYAPVTKQHVGADGMSVGELCEAAIIWSDNTAANLLLRSMGGPSAVTDHARSLGDEVTRLDRTEPDLNEATPGDPRDTTTPKAMAENLKRLTIEKALSDASRDQLIGWLVGCKTGDAKLRAGLPKAWRVGDKTGSGAYGSSNDVAVIWPAADRPPLIVTAYLTGTTASDDKRNATHAAIGRAVAGAISG
jgi:beta-lactamase class A